MVKKLKKKFVLYSFFSVFILIFIIFLSINLINFSLVAQNADRLTEMLAMNSGEFKPEGEEPQDGEEKPEGFGPMGPESPETSATTRYFTYSFDKDGNIVNKVHHIFNYTEEQAIEIAKSLLNAQEVGWVNGTYRYRVYKKNKITYVTVIDQARELQPTYYVLWISLVGLLLGSGISLAILIVVSGRVVKPVLESDRKQKRFIEDATAQIKSPITIIEQSNTLLNKDNLEEMKDVISRQITKMNNLVNNMETLNVLDNIEENDNEVINVKEQMSLIIFEYQDKFKQKNISFESVIPDDLTVNMNKDLFKQVIKEITDNAYKYAKSEVNLFVEKVNDRVTIQMTNDAPYLKDGELDRVFERFYRLDNEATTLVDGNGIGLAVVRNIVKSYNGRYSAKALNKQIIIKIEI